MAEVEAPCKRISCGRFRDSADPSHQLEILPVIVKADGHFSYAMAAAAGSTDLAKPSETRPS
jgi:hypothetical protein